MNRVCHHILKIILLYAGIRPVTFSLVCKRWRQIVRGLTLEEKWSYQLQKAREAKVFLADKFSFENLLGLQCTFALTDYSLLYFAHKLIRKGDITYTYGDFTVTCTEDIDVIVDGPKFTYFADSKRFKSLIHYKTFAGTFVYDLKCFQDQYQWTGKVMIEQQSLSYLITGMVPHGHGVAKIKGRSCSVVASYGVLHWNDVNNYPDMTANLNL